MRGRRAGAVCKYYCFCGDIEDANGEVRGVVESCQWLHRNL